MQYKVWIILNCVSVVNILIVFLSDTFNNSVQNIPLTHFVYNITSVAVIIPAIILGLTGLWQGYTYLVLLFITCILFNFIISKILFSKALTNMYKHYVKPHTTVVIVVLILTLLAFAIF